MTATESRPAGEPRYEVALDLEVRSPARDGVELSANVWRILEMIPYGKDNTSAPLDDALQILGVPARAELDAHVVCRWQERETGRDGELTRIEILADSRLTSTATAIDLVVRLEVDVMAPASSNARGTRRSRATWSDAQRVGCRTSGSRAMHLRGIRPR